MNNKKYLIMLLTSIVIVIVATISITYAYLSFSATQTANNVISTTCYDLTFTDSNAININSYPMSSAKAFTLTPYHFTLKNNCSVNSEYQIILNVLNTTSNNILPYINFSFDKSNPTKLNSLTPSVLPAGVSTNNIKSSYIIASGSLNGQNASKNFDLYMWIDESAGNDIMGQNFEAEIMIYNTPIASS